MKHRILLLLLAGMLVPSLAMAYPLGLVSEADCDGWSATATVTYGQNDRNPVLTYNVVLTDFYTGAVVDEDYNSEPLEFVSSTIVNYDYSGNWYGLCGKFTVNGSFVLTGTGLYKEQTFTYTFTCVCDEPGCFRTPGYWKNHTDDPAWPVGGFAIGGVHYTNAELIEIMKTPPAGGDMTIILAHHLIAAKLNVMGGEDGHQPYNDAIAEADALLAMYPLFSMPIAKDIKEELEEVKDVLEGYNEQECDEFDDGNIHEKDALEESTTWGGLKSSFR